jgi:hypothetical protein
VSDYISEYGLIHRPRDCLFHVVLPGPAASAGISRVRSGWQTHDWCAS